MGQLGGDGLLRGLLRAQALARYRGAAFMNPLCLGSRTEGVLYATRNGAKRTPAAGQRDGLPRDRGPWPRAGTAYPERRARMPGAFSRRRSGIKRVSERWARAGGAMAAENGAAARNAADWRRECAAMSTNSAAGEPERRAAEFAISGAGGVPARRGLRNPPLCEPLPVSTRSPAYSHPSPLRPADPACSRIYVTSARS